MPSSVFALVLFAGLSPSGALDDAVAASPEVAAAAARVTEAAATLAAARGTLVPSLTAGYAQIPQGNPPGPNVIARLASVGLQTNVADFVAYGAAVRENVLLLESSRDDALVADRDERIKTAGLYFNALEARAVVAARARALELATAQRDAAQTRFAAGDGPRLDVVRADVAVAKATADLESARGDDANKAEALALETGRPVTDFQATTNATPQPGFDGKADEPDPDPAAAVSRALGVRAEIASARTALHAQEAARQAAAAGGFPALLVGGGYTTGTDSGVPVGAPSVNVALTLPLGPGARDRTGIEDGKLVEARANVEREMRSVALEVGAAARDVGTLRRAAAAATRAREGAESELAATDLGYRSGASSSLEVRAAQAGYAQALIDESTALYDVAKARAILALEVGR